MCFISPYLCLAILFFWNLARATSTNDVRVALMTFTVDDNSYRSALAAADLATLLQGELSSESGMRWVERSELKAAEREFELSQFGLPDKVGALRRGHYVSADWIVTGTFSVSTNQQWTLGIQVIDARRADVLAARTAQLSRTAHPTLKSALPQVVVIAAEVRKTLRAAADRWKQVRSRPTLALLMLLDAEESEPGLAEALERCTNSASSWRVARFTALADASPENELTLLGLTEEAAVRDKLADAYAWGRLAVTHRMLVGRIPSPDYVPVLEVTVWGGQGEPQTISIEGNPVGMPDPTFAQVPALIRRIETNSLRMQIGVPESKVLSAVRARIAQSLFERAKTWRSDGEHWSKWRSDPDRWVREEIKQQVRLLEAACFFDPRHQGAFEALARIQTRSGWQFTSNRFLMLKNVSDLWANYVDRFGISSVDLPQVGSEMDFGPVAGNYVQSAFQLVDLCALGNKEDFGFPRDMSGATARYWLKGFTTDLTQRIIRTANEPTTRVMAAVVLRDGLTGSPKPLMMVEPKLRRQCIEALWPPFAESVPPGHSRRNYAAICESLSATYAELGILSQAEKLFAMLDKTARPKTNGATSNAPVRLPRANELDPLPHYRR